LCTLVGIARRASVAHAHVEIAGGVERDLAAVVIGKRLVDVQQDLLARRVRSVGGNALEARHDGVALLVRVVDEETAVALVVGIEREAEEAAFAA
jgi:uncharacterized heparinase superfamily protein